MLQTTRSEAGSRGTAPCRVQGTGACRAQWDRSRARPLGETARRKIGNCKEHRLRCDYACSPGRNRQAERRKSQGVLLAARLCEFPGLAPLSRFGTGARRTQWAKQAGGTSGNGKERLRDYSVSRVGSPNIIRGKAVSEQTAKRSTIETGLMCKAAIPACHHIHEQGGLLHPVHLIVV